MCNLRVLRLSAISAFLSVEPILGSEGSDQLIHERTVKRSLRRYRGEKTKTSDPSIDFLDSTMSNSHDEPPSSEDDGSMTLEQPSLLDTFTEIIANVASPSDPGSDQSPMSELDRNSFLGSLWQIFGNGGSPSGPDSDEPPTSEPTSVWPTYSPTTTYPTFSPVDADSNVPVPATEAVAFRRGDLSVRNRRLGIDLCAGMSAKVIAKANEKIQLSDGRYSDIPFHSMADGAAIFPLDNGYVYVSNAEMKERKGGVYGLYFDNEGNAVDYKQLLSGTTRNCGGGRTPWNTWISCEEYANGQCWQIDPEDQISPQVTKLGGSGGNYESVAVDNRNERQPIFYVTEDARYGALRKYTPPLGSTTANWDTIHSNGGTTKFLRFVSSDRFEWTTDEDAARTSQSRYFRNVEGIDFHNGYLYFVSKYEYVLYVLDLDNGTYKTSSTEWGVMAEGGEFEYSPDQIVHNGGEYLYFTEDGGNTVGVYAVHKPTGKRYAIFEGYAQKYYWDETTGLAFSVDGTKMYAAFQDCGCENSSSGVDYNCGCLMEFSRDDGKSFDGSTMALKYHSS